jgi:hypothetical protein
MKTTVEIPDTLYRQVKARAALKEQSIKDFLVEAVRAKLALEKAKPDKRSKKKIGWEVAWGTADPKEIADLQRIIDEEFS